MLARQQVLLIEDEPDLVAIVSETLRDEGYDVVAVNDGRAGLARARTDRPGLILLDLWMPGMDGREFLRIYSDQPSPRAPVILVTAGATQGAAVDGLGADAILAKPFDLDELVSVVGKYLASPESALSAAASPLGGILNQVEASERVAGRPPDQSSRTVLVVEDERSMREVLAGALELEGYIVETAVDGVQALERLDRAQPDLIMLDLMMPRMDGRALVGELARRGLRPAIPILLLSASNEARSAAALLEVESCVGKPFDLGALLDEVARLIDR